MAKRKRKEKKRMTKFTKILCLVLIAVSGFLLYSAAKEVMTTMELRKEVALANEKLELVQDEYQYLVNKKEKLLDPDYVESYARSNYMFSKDGETIFYLPQNDGK